MTMMNRYSSSVKVFDEPHTPYTLRKELKANGVNKNKFIDPNYSDSYLLQIRTIKDLNIKSILEIGPGDGTVGEYLKKLNISYCSIDNSNESKPTILTSLENLDPTPYAKKYECVCAFQMLEHSPYENFVQNIEKMKKMSSKYILISLPYSCFGFNFNLTLHKGQNRKVKTTFSHYFPLNLPNRKYRTMYQKEFPWAVHYWEIGRMGYPLRKVIKDMESAGLNILNRFHSPNPFHYFILANV